jgi:hypothetical protein
MFGYESVTSIAAIDPPVDRAVIVTRPDAILHAARSWSPDRIAPAKARALPLSSVISAGNAMHLGVEDYPAWPGERRRSSPGWQNWRAAPGFRCCTA